eukprot:4167000-Amphidinium_carterae.1
MQFECEVPKDAFACLLVALKQSRSWLQHLDLTFDSWMDDERLQSLAACLPEHLRRRTLDVARGALGDEGVAALAAKLPETLEHLDLYFYRCKKV